MTTPNAQPPGYKPGGVPPIISGGRPSPTARREAVVTARAAAGQPPPHQSVYQPWGALLKQADARFKTEISAAVADLERAAADAGQLLDRAHALAEETAGNLEQAAWTAWHKYMAAADASRSAILGPAVKGYDQAMAYAAERYARALADAEKTYKSIRADANRAQSDTKQTA